MGNNSPSAHGYLANSVEYVPILVLYILKLEDAHPATEQWSMFVLCFVALYAASRFSGWWLRFMAK